MQSDAYPKPLQFEDYRNKLDESSEGLMRFGLETVDLYQEALELPEIIIFDEKSILKGIIAAVPNSLIDAYKPEITDKNMVAIHPAHEVYSKYLKEKLVFRHLVGLSRETTQSIFQGTEEMMDLINQEVFNSLKESDLNLIGSDGVKNYMLFSKYNTSNIHEKYNDTPQDIETSTGHIITSNRQKILDNIEALIDLQESVFENQAATIGYYDGLRGHEVIELLNNSNFIPIAAIDPKTQDVEMFALFSPNFDNLNSIPWLSPKIVEKHLKQTPQADVLVMPLIMTSKFSGLGFLRHVVDLALQEIVHKYKPNTMAVMYENNGLSVNYIPRVIEREITKNGAPSVYHYAEAYFYSQKA